MAPQERRPPRHGGLVGPLLGEEGAVRRLRDTRRPQGGRGVLIRRRGVSGNDLRALLREGGSRWFGSWRVIRDCRGGPRSRRPALRRRSSTGSVGRPSSPELPHYAQDHLPLPTRQAGALPRDGPGRVVAEGLDEFPVEGHLPVPVHQVGGLDAEHPRQGDHMAQAGIWQAPTAPPRCRAARGWCVSRPALP